MGALEDDTDTTDGLRLRLDVLLRDYRALRQLLDHLAIGIALIHPPVRLALANRAALDILRAADGLSIHRGGLNAWHRSDQQTLEHALDLAGRGPAPHRVLHIERPSGKAPLWILVLGPQGNHRGLRSVAICLGDPTRPQSPSGDLIHQFYGLTRAECRLLVELMDGRRLAEIGREFGVTGNTLRTELQSIFAKTGTSRQSELIRLVSSGPCQIYGPPSR